MEPKLTTPSGGHEQMPAPQEQRSERLQAAQQLEQLVERGHERHEQRGEILSAQPPISLPTPVVTPLPPPVSPDDSQTLTSDDNPIVAADDDLIEKEWVDRAKKIIQQTKDDPFRREQEVSRLQADYLKKRYGKELGASE